MHWGNSPTGALWVSLSSEVRRESVNGHRALFFKVQGGKKAGDYTSSTGRMCQGGVVKYCEGSSHGQQCSNNAYVCVCVCVVVEFFFVS